MIGVAKENEAELGEREARELAGQLYPQSWSQKANNPAYDRPPDLGLIRQEIARLALSAYPGRITSELIRAEVERGDEDKIFRFLDAAIAGNLDVALPELDRLLVAGEDPGRLLSQLAQNVELSSVVASAGSRNPADVGKDIGMNNPNRMTMIARGVQGMNRGRLQATLDAVTTADRRIKRGELKDQIDGLYEALTAIAAARRAR
jgi:DNA polymerase III delta subunit